MSDTRKVSRRGVYYDLTISPYEYKTPYGDVFKFSSEKKLDIYTREIDKEVMRVASFLSRNRLSNFLPVEIVGLIERSAYKALYKKIEG